MEKEFIDEDRDKQRKTFIRWIDEMEKWDEEVTVWWKEKKKTSLRRHLCLDNIVERLTK